MVRGSLKPQSGCAKKRRRRSRLASLRSLQIRQPRKLPPIDRSNIVPFEAKRFQHALVQLDDALIFPVAGWILGLRVQEIVAEIDGERLETTRDRTRAASVHPDDGDRARTVRPM